MRSLTLVLVALVLVGCRVDVGEGPPAGAMLRCADGACPTGMNCDPLSELCWTPGASSRADGETCTANADCVDANCVAGICCADGCVEDGGACLDANDCQNGHCDHGVCCVGGTCCAGTLANCPADYSECTSVTTCTGVAHTFSCPTSGTNAYSCVEAVGASTTACDGATCSNVSCVGGRLTPAQQCAAGICPAGASTTCPNSAACESVTTCAGSCTLDTQNGCTGGAWCRLVDSAPTCVMNGQLPGDPCVAGTDCAGSGHCEHNLCCASGTCCNGTTANCPANADVCTSQATCNATSTTYSCPTTGATAFSCVASESPGTACTGLVANTCGLLKDAICPTTTCLAYCDSDAGCDTGAFCSNPGPSTGVCVGKYGAGVVCTASNECQSGLTCGGSSTAYCPSPFTSCVGPTAKVCCAAERCCNGADNAKQCGYYRTCDTPSACDGRLRVAACTSGSCDFTPASATVTNNDTACNYDSGANLTHKKPAGTCGNHIYVTCTGGSDQSSLTCPTKCRVYSATPAPSCVLAPSAPCEIGYSCSPGTPYTCADAQCE